MGGDESCNKDFCRIVNIFRVIKENVVLLMVDPS